MAPKHELNFLEFLNSFRRGELLSEGDEKLNELMTAIQKTGTAGVPRSRKRAASSIAVRAL